MVDKYKIRARIEQLQKQHVEAELNCQTIIGRIAELNDILKYVEDEEAKQSLDIADFGKLNGEILAQTDSLQTTP